MLEPAPCDHCRLAERCKVKHLACRAFSLFMAGASPIAWNAVNRAPTRERYEALLGDGATAPRTVSGTSQERPECCAAASDVGVPSTPQVWTENP
jgi:hypothetical protein